jgi:hypothetical protein
MKAKMAWLVYENEYDEDDNPSNLGPAQIYFAQPDRYYSKIVPIVYFEVEE